MRARELRGARQAKNAEHVVAIEDDNAVVVRHDDAGRPKNETVLKAVEDLGPAGGRKLTHFRYLLSEKSSWEGFDLFFVAVGFERLEVLGRLKRGRKPGLVLRPQVYVHRRQATAI